MELENQAARNTYIQLLVDTLQKKSKVLKLLMNITEQQENIISAPNFNEDEFLKTISLKEEQIQTLEKLDNGFDQIYESIKEELANKKEKFGTEIASLKVLIVEITDMSVKLQALERRNKSKMEVIFSNKRREIKNSRLSNQTVANYYKNMSKQQEAQSYFYDKKK
jgi:hypothetical protein